MKFRKNKSFKRKIDKVLEVPDEIALNTPKITISNFEQMLIENYKGILEYQDFYIRIKTSIGIININGFNMTLEEMTTDDIIVKGNIENVDFESIEDIKEE